MIGSNSAVSGNAISFVALSLEQRKSCLRFWDKGIVNPEEEEEEAEAEEDDDDEYISPIL